MQTAPERDVPPCEKTDNGISWNKAWAFAVLAYAHDPRLTANLGTPIPSLLVLSPWHSNGVGPAHKRCCPGAVDVHRAHMCPRRLD